MQEQQLIERAVAGDGAALATLLQEAEQAILAHAHSRMSPQLQLFITAEDIFQETCYEACRMVGGYTARDEKHFRYWLLKIARFRIKTAIQKHRVRRARKVSSDDSMVLSTLDQFIAYRRTPSRSAAAHELMSRVNQALEQLIPDYRQVITYRFMEGLSVEETGKKMGRDSDKIYVLSSRALGALRAHMQSRSHYI